MLTFVHVQFHNHFQTSVTVNLIHKRKNIANWLSNKGHASIRSSLTFVLEYGALLKKDIAFMIKSYFRLIQNFLYNLEIYLHQFQHNVLSTIGSRQDCLELRNIFISSFCKTDILFAKSFIDSHKNGREDMYNL